MIANMKLPPHSTDAEQGVIGSLLLNPESDNAQKTLAVLKAESFYNKAHQVIYQAIKSMAANQQTIDGLTLTDNLEKQGVLNQVGGFAYIAEITKNTPSAANIKGYAKIVRDNAIERIVIAKTNEIQELIYTPSNLSAQDKLATAQQLFMQLEEQIKTGSRRGARHVSDVIDDWLLEVEDRFGNPDRVRGLSTGIPSLDAKLAPKGLVNGSLFVVGARPKMGKTTLYSQMAIHCAMVEKLPVIAFSLEMPDKQIIERMIGQMANVNTDIFYRGSDNDSDFARTMKSAGELQQSKLYIDDTAGSTLAHIVAESRRIKREQGVVGMILVDYLTLMKTEKADRNDLAYGMITKGLKNLAKELNCVVVLLTQLNRDLEKRNDKRPLPSDSRDTGQIEQDCDYWVGIYREGAYDENKDQSFTELLLRLNRHGKSGVCYVEQKNGAIYDLDQTQAANRFSQDDEKSNKRYSKGGF